MAADIGASIARRLVHGTGWLMIWRVISRSLGFVSMLILAHLLMPADFGLVALATAVSASVDAVSQLGVRDALIRLHDDRRDYYDTAFTFQLARGLLTALLLVILSGFSQEVFGDQRLPGVLIPLAAFTVVTACENVGTVSLHRTLNFRVLALMQVAPRLFGFAVTTTLAFMLHDYRALVWGMGAGRVAGMIATYVVAPYRPRFGLAGWRYLLHFSFWTWAGGLAMVVWSRADAYLLGPALGSAMLGIYLLGAEIAMLPLSELLEPACTTLFPGFALARRSGSEPVSMGLMVAGVLALCTIPVGIGVSACSGYLVAALLGPNWESARPVIAILTWVCMFSPFSFVCSTLLSAHGQVWRVFASNAVAATLKVVVVLMVRQTHDLTAISMAGVAVVAVESAIFILQLRSASEGKLPDIRGTVLRAVVSTAATCAAIRLLPGTWDEVTLGRYGALVVGAGIGLLTIVVFGVCQLMLWRMARCPAGIEMRLIELIRDIVRPGAWLKTIRANVRA